MIGTGELIVILIIVLLLFGPKKLPQLARSIGKSVSEYRKGLMEEKQKNKKKLAG